MLYDDLPSVSPRAVQPGLATWPNIKNIIAIASGKGGVGKSTVAFNIARTLFQAGLAVGLLDADIYGPSQPTLLNAVSEKPVVEAGKLMPIERMGLKTMSIGYLVDQKAALAWRGPMLGKALQQLLNDTVWGALDYLIIDMPPGTGDVQLTLCQKIPLSGAVMVTTPDDIALADVRRAAQMFAQLSIPLLGVVENMSVYHCPSCQHPSTPFGEKGGQAFAEAEGLPLLGALPLYSRESVNLTESEAKAYHGIAKQLLSVLSGRPKHYGFPKIVEEKK